MEIKEEIKMAGNSLMNSPLGQLFRFIQKEMILKGIIMTLLGVMVLFRPGMTMTLITMIVGAIITVDGAFLLAAVIRCKGPGKLIHLIGAILFLGAGIFSMISPVMVNIFWVIMIGIWQLLSGIQQCFCCIRNVRFIALLSGIFTILCGLFLISSPLIGVVAIAWLIGLLLLINGLSEVLLGMKLRSILK